VISRLTERGGHLPVALSVRIVAEVAGALHHAHTARDATGRPMGIVHRDVTPENIMLGYDGVSRLLDFGIAKATTQHDKTQAGELKGKFAYMSPEQYQGEDLDGRSDVFSLGVCLFEALTGESLYARQSEYETVAAIVLETTIPSIRDLRPELPPALDAIVQTALAKRREDRFQDADAMQASLELYLADTSQIVRDAEVGTYVRKLFADEVDRAPRLDRTPLAPPRAEVTGAQPLDEIERLAIGVEVDDAEAQFATAGRRKRLAIGLLVAFVVLAILGVAGLALREGPPRGAHEGAPSPAPAEP
jgi:serine/threonine protein kinase